MNENSDDRNYQAINNQIYSSSLQYAKDLYGPKNDKFKISEIIYLDEGNPNVSIVSPNRAELSVNKNCRNDISRATLQIGHEVIHCLFPKNKDRVSYLEEGLATHFSLQLCRRDDLYTQYSDEQILNGPQKYLQALALFTELITFDSEAIHKIRSVNTHLDSLTKEQILQAIPSLPEDLASGLASPFY